CDSEPNFTIHRRSAASRTSTFGFDPPNFSLTNSNGGRGADSCPPGPQVQSAGVVGRGSFHRTCELAQMPPNTHKMIFLIIGLLLVKTALHVRPEFPKNVEANVGDHAESEGHCAVSRGCLAVGLPSPRDEGRACRTSDTRN